MTQTNYKPLIKATGDISAFLTHMNWLDFEICRAYGLDIGILKSLIDCDLHHRLYPKENPDSGFLFLNNQYWYKFRLERKIEWIPLWNLEKAQDILQALIHFELIKIIGNALTDEEILILLEE